MEKETVNVNMYLEPNLFENSVLSFSSQTNFLSPSLHFLFPHGSGNTDAVLPVTSTRYSIDALKLPTLSPWRAWYDDGEVN